MKNASKKELELTVVRKKKELARRYKFSAENNMHVVLKLFNSSTRGLKDEDSIEEMRDVYGENVITGGKEVSTLKRVVEAFVNPFTAILFVLAIVSVVTDIVIPLSQGVPENVNPLTAIIIITMVVISGVLRFVQETRSGNAAASLLAMITTTATVERPDDEGNTARFEIPLEELVVGDIVHLSAGDMLPADVRIIKAKDFFVSQSALTGESEPFEKIADALEDAPKDTADCANLAFMGSNVVSGAATAVIIAVGNDTMFGSLAKATTGEATVTSFEKGVNQVSMILIRFMLVMVPIVFFASGITKNNWMEAFLFAVAVAVGLTPEMLPMIVTTCLAKGAVAMSKQKTIIKNLNSMQNFGAIDVLCTDKTGTITQDKVVLQYHLNVHGQEDERVLRHGFLNSYYQTGLKNLMDVAIIEKTKEDAKWHGLSENYEKVDEIPFDFERRRMTVVVEDKNGKRQMITKGAVEEMLGVCKFVDYHGETQQLTESLKREILTTVDDLNDDGMRVIAVAQKTNPSPVGAFSVNDEDDMVLIGYLAFLDPPKETTESAIAALLEYGVTTKILTGDNDRVTRCICKQVGLKVDNLLLGSDVEDMDDVELADAVETTNVFAKLSPEQKARVVTALRDNGHVVGFMGDGINDAAAMKASDIGISVDTAVDIAKESADIILLEKDLGVLEKGLIEGRKTYANMIKYIKMTASSNFGNMFSMVIAAAALPFLPMLSAHIIILNLIYDISCTAIPWDNVDLEYLKQPRKWASSSIGKFMIRIGPISSVFDITTYALMYFIICPKFVSGGLLFHQIPANETAMRAMYIAMFQAGWFVESMWSQTLVIHMIRSPKLPFIKSRASFQLTTLTFAGIGLLTAIPFTPFGAGLGLAPLPMEYFGWLACTVVAYMLLTTVSKRRYIRKYKELL